MVKSKLNAAIENAITSHRIVGTVVVVLQNGKQIYGRAAGFADREAGIPMRKDAIFRLASISKPIVSVAALRLVDEGVLGLDEALTRYLPNFRPRLDTVIPPITIRHLLTHTAGLSYGFLEPPDGPYHKARVSDGLDQPGLSMADELGRITSAGLAYPPGSAWRYSVALDVLGAVMEKAADESLPHIVKKWVTGPAGMADTGFEPPETARLVTPYADGAPPVRMGDPHLVPFMDFAGIRFSPGRVFVPQSFPSAGAGMNGTADDVAVLLDLVRKGEGQLLAPETARAMMTNQVGNLTVIKGPGWGFGYGGAVLTDPKAAMTPMSAGTWTWGGVWGHSWFVDPKLDLVVVALTNTAIEGMEGQFPIDIQNAVYKAARGQKSLNHPLLPFPDIIGKGFNSC